MIAITGLIGSGKSFVADVVRQAGFEVLDADKLAHELYECDEPLRKKVIEKFGTVDRKELAKIVFSDAQKLELLESIVHPVLQKEILKRNPKFIEAAVLYKWSEFAKKMEAIWVVEADENIRIQRLLKKGMNIEDIKNRMESQNIISLNTPRLHTPPFGHPSGKGECHPSKRGEDLPHIHSPFSILHSPFFIIPNNTAPEACIDFTKCLIEKL